jgi:hypothetical protein
MLQAYPGQRADRSRSRLVRQTEEGSGRRRRRSRRSGSSGGSAVCFRSTPQWPKLEQARPAKCRCFRRRLTPGDDADRVRQP